MQELMQTARDLGSRAASTLNHLGYALCGLGRTVVQFVRLLALAIAAGCLWLDAWLERPTWPDEVKLPANDERTA